jgi:hypothetical protein
MNQNPYESPKAASAHQNCGLGAQLPLRTQYMVAAFLIALGLALHATAIIQGQIWAAGISALLSISSGIWLATLIWPSAHS